MNWPFKVVWSRHIKSYSIFDTDLKYYFSKLMCTDFIVYDNCRPVTPFVYLSWVTCKRYHDSIITFVVLGLSHLTLHIFTVYSWSTKENVYETLSQYMKSIYEVIS